MRILIDERLDWRLARGLTGHDAVSVQKMGRSGIKNGKLLDLAERNEFEVFLTADRNLAFQQNVPNLRIAVIVLHAPGIQLKFTLPLMSKILEVLPSVAPGTVTVIT